MEPDVELLTHIFLLSGPGWGGMPWLTVERINEIYERPGFEPSLKDLTRKGYLETSEGMYRITDSGAKYLLAETEKFVKSMGVHL